MLSTETDSVFLASSYCVPTKRGSEDGGPPEEGTCKMRQAGCLWQYNNSKKLIIMGKDTLWVLEI